MSKILGENQKGTFGLRVVTEMHRQAFTIPGLARAAGLPLNTVQKICKGKGVQTSLWTAWALADVLEVDIDYLCGRKDHGR